MPNATTTDIGRHFGRSPKTAIIHPDLANGPEADAVPLGSHQILADSLRLVADARHEIADLMISVDTSSVADLLAGLSRLQHDVAKLREGTFALRAAFHAEDA